MKKRSITKLYEAQMQDIGSATNLKPAQPKKQSYNEGDGGAALDLLDGLAEVVSKGHLDERGKAQLIAWFKENQDALAQVIGVKTGFKDEDY